MTYNLTNIHSFRIWVKETNALTTKVSKTWFFPKWFSGKEIERLVSLVKNGSQYLEHSRMKIFDPVRVGLMLERAERILKRKKVTVNPKVEK